MLKATVHVGALTMRQETDISEALDKLDLTWMFEQDEDNDTFVLHVAGVDTNPALALVCNILAKPHAVD